MSEKFEILSLEDVVALDNNDKEQNTTIDALLLLLKISYLFGVSDFLDSLLLSSLKDNDKTRKILKEGISCRVMTTREKGWVSGKVRIGLHFIADEVPKDNEEKQSNSNSNSPLDEIRNNIE